MEENAQLRAEKMLLTTSSISTSNNLTPTNQPVNNYENEVGLYSTVKNKKFHMLKENFGLCAKFKSDDKKQEDQHSNNSNTSKFSHSEQNFYDNGNNLNSPIFQPNKQHISKQMKTSSSENVFNEFYVPNKSPKSNMNFDGGYEISIISYEG